MNIGIINFLTFVCFALDCFTYIMSIRHCRSNLVKIVQISSYYNSCSNVSGSVWGSNGVVARAVVMVIVVEVLVAAIRIVLLKVWHKM